MIGLKTREFLFKGDLKTIFDPQLLVGRWASIYVKKSPYLIKVLKIL